MSNMSYCRFENTNTDLADCIEALEGLRGGDQGSLSDSELMKAKALVSQCAQLIEMIQDESGADLMECGWNTRDRVIGDTLDKMNDAAKADEEDDEEEADEIHDEDDGDQEGV